MLVQVKTTNWIIKRTSVFCGLLFAAVLALLPDLAEAQCKSGWDATGSHGIRQVGIRYGLTFELQQSGRVITGRAYGLVDNKTGGVDKLDGTVDGTMDGFSSAFRVQIFWKNGQTGVYDAKILPSGRLDGIGYEKGSPNVRVPWHSDGVLKCAPPPPVVPKLPPFVPKPLKSTGKAKPAPPKPPFIYAGQAIIPTPAHPFGIVPLSWDGGPDHPNVEVVLSMDNGAEIPAYSIGQAAQSPVWKQSKTSIALQLQRYHHYKFVLKSAGKTLSTAAFVVP